MVAPYLIVTGDFGKAGGMDQANYALASYLMNRDREVHLVAHYAHSDLLNHPNAVFHIVPKLGGSYLLSQPALDRAGRHWAAEIRHRGGRVIVNGGNCDWNDVNWVHHVQATCQPAIEGNPLSRLKNAVHYRLALSSERRIIPRATAVITQSEFNKRQLVERLGVPAALVHTVYLGIDSKLFHPPTSAERATSRILLGAVGDEPIVSFVGALGDNRKGFDTLFTAWTRLCARSGWKAKLIVVGKGAEAPLWQTRAKRAAMDSRIRFMGFDSDPGFVARIMAGCDLLVLPSRYEGYGRPVQEALCCGLPAFVTRTSGVADHFTDNLADLVIPDPTDPEDLANRLWQWAKGIDSWKKKRIEPLSSRLRKNTWENMAKDMAAIIEQYPYSRDRQNNRVQAGSGYDLKSA